MPVGSEIDDALAVSCVELMAWPLVTGDVSTSLVSPDSDPRSVGAYDLVGMSSMATIPLETMAWPVVPAGMSVLATTADVLTGAAMFVPDDACLLAPSTLANAIALPAMNRITPIMTNMAVCFFTALPPLNKRTTGGDPSRGHAAVGSVEGTTGVAQRT